VLSDYTELYGEGIIQGSGEGYSKWVQKMTKPLQVGINLI